MCCRTWTTPRGTRSRTTSGASSKACGRARTRQRISTRSWTQSSRKHSRWRMGEPGAVERRGLRSLFLIGRWRGGFRVAERFGPRTRKATARSVFFAPALLFIVFLVVYPVLQTVYLSFVSSAEVPTFGNYKTVLTDPETINPNLASPPPLGTLLPNALWVALHLLISLLF